ncbi:MAG: hypothetical protein UR84_C0024G0009 [candidate division WS6 bacterium GW2011_GWD1_35_594]|nr:MAG: hypothetical protein UR84_C0024G0009 [candidate division WS6 bacterium GW2011_GWD1_35_594]
MATNKRKGRTTPNMEGNQAYNNLSNEPRNLRLFKIAEPTDIEKNLIGKELERNIARRMPVDEDDE